jgi:hypothetical protein
MCANASFHANQARRLCWRTALRSCRVTTSAAARWRRADRARRRAQGREQNGRPKKKASFRWPRIGGAARGSRRMATPNTRKFVAYYRVSTRSAGRCPPQGLADAFSELVAAGWCLELPHTLPGRNTLPYASPYPCPAEILNHFSGLPLRTPRQSPGTLRCLCAKGRPAALRCGVSRRHDTRGDSTSFERRLG